MLLQDPSQLPETPYSQCALGVRISEPPLLLSGAFLSKFLGAKCEGLMITLLVISPLSVPMCSCSTLFPQPRKEANLFTLVCGWARESEET